MSPLRYPTFALLAGLSGFVAARHARGAPCGRPDIDLTFPPNDATRVPPNARLSAHYAAPASYDDETVSLVDASGAEVPLAVSFDAADSMLRATPEQPLAAGFHQLGWPGLRGLSGAGVGLGRSISFFVQPELDQAAPSFEGLREIAWDLARDRDPCLDRLEDRFVFELSLGSASDDAGAELLQVLVFETREPGANEPGEPLRVALRALPDSGRVEVRRPAEEAGQTCFAAVVQDLLGNVSGGGEREVCIKTKKPPFFDGCSVAPPVAPGAERAGIALLVATLGLWSRRRGARAAARRAR